MEPVLASELELDVIRGEPYQDPAAVEESLVTPPSIIHTLR
jgi:hypothetical protein